MESRPRTGAKNIPLSTLRTRIDELADDQRYIAVCRSGSRSRSATAQLRATGIEVVNLEGRMAAWRRAGHHSTRATAASSSGPGVLTYFERRSPPSVTSISRLTAALEGRLVAAVAAWRQ